MYGQIAVAIAATAVTTLAGSGMAGAAALSEPPTTVFRGLVGCERNDADHQDRDDKGCPVVLEPAQQPPSAPPAEPPAALPPQAAVAPSQQVLGTRVVRPVLGRTVVVEADQPGVRVRRRGSKRFELLTEAEAIPVGSTIDATRGRVRLTSAADASEAVQQGVFYGGRFVARQKRSRRPITVLALSGPVPGCAQAKSSRSGRRRLFGSGRGRFRTRGRNASATVRGTSWVTEDRCDGTLVRVKEGTVVVRDFTVGRVVNVRAGERYFAPAARPPITPAFTG